MCVLTLGSLVDIMVAKNAKTDPGDCAYPVLLVPRVRCPFSRGTGQTVPPSHPWTDIPLITGLPPAGVHMVILTISNKPACYRYQRWDFRSSPHWLCPQSCFQLIDDHMSPDVFFIRGQQSFPLENEALPLHISRMLLVLKSSSNV